MTWHGVCHPAACLRRGGTRALISGLGGRHEVREVSSYRAQKGEKRARPNRRGCRVPEHTYIPSLGVLTGRSKGSTSVDITTLISTLSHEAPKIDQN